MAGTYSESILVKLTPDQRTELKASAVEKGMTVNAYIRERVFGEEPTPLDPWGITIERRVRALENAAPAMHYYPRSRSMAQLYEYAVILQEKRDKDGEEIEPAAIVVEPTTVVAQDEGQAQLLAARAIPEELTKNGKLSRLTVVVRSF